MSEIGRYYGGENKSRIREISMARAASLRRFSRNLSR